NFSPADAKSIIWNLTQRSQFYLEPNLVEELVRELAGEVGEVRPIELQIVGAQLQTEQITTLEQFQTRGTKDELVQQFLADVVKDCGAGNEKIASLLLCLLTDANDTRPLKTREDLELELEVQAEKLDLFLEVLVKSGIVLRVPGFPADRYQLVHDYLVTFIRTQNPELARLTVEVEREREQRKFTEKKLNEALTRELREARRGLVWKVGLGAIAGGLAMVLPWVLISQNNTHLSSMSAESKRFLGANKDLQALVESIKAGKRLKRWEIGVKPETKKQVETALQEVVHTIRERNSFEGHKDSVTSVSFSPDGKLIASGSADNTVKLWSLDGKEIASFEEHEDTITSIAFSPNGQIIASVSADNIVKLWKREGKEGNRLVSWKGHKESITSITFSPNGQIIASVSEDETVKIWSLDGKEITTFKEHKDKITGVAFSPDSQMVASSSEDKTVRLWNLEGKELKTLNHYDSVTSVSFSPAGEMFPKEFGLTIISLSTNYPECVNIWRSDGSLLTTIDYGGGNLNIKGKTIIQSGYDNAINLRLLQTDNKYKATYITFNGHRNKVNSVSFSPDVKLLASGSEDNTVKLWNLETSGFENLRDLASINISPDGKMITSVSTDYPRIIKDELKLWSLDGKTIETLKGVHANASFSPDSQMLASASMDRTVKLWSKDLTGLDSQKNIASVSYSENGQAIALVKADNTVQLLGKDGRLLTTLKGHKEKIYRVDFSADGQTVAITSNDQTIKLWQRDGTLLTTLKGHRDKIYRVYFSADGQTIATASDDQTVKLWQQNGTLIKTLAGYRDEIQGLNFSPNGETLAIHGGDNTVKFLRLDGTLIDTVKGYGYQEMQVSFSPDSETLGILHGGKDENKLEIRYIDGTLLKTFQVNGSLKGFSDDGKTIVTENNDKMQFWELDGTLLSTFEKDVWKYSPDYRMMLTKEDRKNLKLWRRDGTQISTIPIKGKSLSYRYGQGNVTFYGDRQFLLSPDNQTLALETSQNTVELWRSDGTFIKTIKIESERFRNSRGKLISLPMSFSPNSQILAIRTDDNKVELWSVDGKLIDTIQGSGDVVTDLNFLPESETLVISGYDDTVKLWQRDGTELKVLPDHSNQVNRVSFSPDGKTIASASDDKTFKLWNREGTLIKTIDKHSDKVNDVSFSPDGKVIASASDDFTVKLWKRDGTLIKSLKEHSNGVNRVSFHPNGKLIASASEDKTVKLWSLDEQDSRHTLDHDYPVTSISFHPDGELIASASWKTVKLWSIDGEEIATFERLRGGDVSFSPDGNSIVGISGSWDNQQIAFWNSDLDELLKRGCNWARDYLKNNPSVEERDRKLCDDIGTQE
ncbi:MAG: WD40 repeat domain-containing protein, partial [Symploca sp. SIO3E6]|nr:WD40 repeat domain-containing protein [Caldora sp. SIO3E6]